MTCAMPVLYRLERSGRIDGDNVKQGLTIMIGQFNDLLIGGIVRRHL